MDQEIKAFDPERACPKCGHGEVSTSYVPPSEKRAAGDYRRPLHEHQERRCLRCRYDWPEYCGKPRKKRKTAA